MGAGVLKLWLNDQPARNYPNFITGKTWPAAGKNTAYPTLASLAAHPFYREAFERPSFRTISLVATEFARVNWRDGLSPTEESAVVAEFQQLTEHLLTTYATHGKTFILQNWEGDNLLNLDQFPDTSTWPAMADGLVAYFKARQRGVTQGRAVAGANSTSQVWNALEINYNWGAARSGDIKIPEEWTLLNRVVRDGYRDHGLLCDLYSWSAWSAKSPGEEYRIVRGIDYMRARVPTAGPFGDRAIFLGEFGAYESSFFAAGSQVHSAASDATFATVNLNQFSYAWRSGVQRAIFWQIYDNGLREGLTFDYNNPVSRPQQDMVGAWLIRPPGPPTHPAFTYTTAHHQFASLMNCWLTEDELTDFSLVLSQSGPWASSTAPQSWAPGVSQRLYRTTSDLATLLYRTDGDLVDFGITAFLYGTTASNFRLRGFTSVDGVNWSSPFAFREFDSAVLDPIAAPDWRRVLLGPNAAIPAGTRFLRIEVNDTGTAWRTQIGNVKLISRGVKPVVTDVPATQVVRAGGALTLNIAATGAGPLRYRWLRNGTFLAETAAPTFTLPSVTTSDAGSYHVEVGNFAGFTASAPFAIQVAESNYDVWRFAQFTPEQLNDPAVSGPAADPDTDGVPNLLAYALGRPAFNVAAVPPIATGTINHDGATYLTLSYTRALDTDDVVLALEFASNPSGPWSADGVILSSEAQGTSLHVTVRDSVSLESATRRFARLTVSR